MISNHYTKEEMRSIFLEHIKGLVEYWENESRKLTSLEKLKGLAFSVLVTLDGGDGCLPAFKVEPDDHSTDKEYHQKRGEKFWPEGYDLAGSLHTDFYEVFEDES